MSGETSSEAAAIPALAAPTGEQVRWLPGAFRRGVFWLVFLGPFFFLTYGFANRHSAALDAAGAVGSFYFAWEKSVPFWPWTIIPYWTIDLLYGFAFLCCRDKAASTRLGLRLLSVQFICVICFLLWPLRFDFIRPQVEGVSGALFGILAGFDMPYNQAPSLHIALLVVIWRQFANLSAPCAVRAFIHAWAILIGVSVLTTWQHHFIDVPTGLAVGLFCLWLWPEKGPSPLKRSPPLRPDLAFRYGIGALAALALALVQGLGTIWIVLGWIAISLAMAAWNYVHAGAAGFQKQHGRHSLASRWLFAPCMFGAHINARLWTRKHPAAILVTEGIWLGRLPGTREFASWAAAGGGNVALFDLTAELPAPRLPDAAVYDGLPCLDLVPVQTETLREAVRRIARLRAEGREVWIACALGFSRSAAVAAAWLRHAGIAANIAEAVARLDTARGIAGVDRVVLGESDLAALTAFERRQKEATS